MPPLSRLNVAEANKGAQTSERLQLGNTSVDQSSPWRWNSDRWRRVQRKFLAWNPRKKHPHHSGLLGSACSLCSTGEWVSADHDDADTHSVDALHQNHTRLKSDTRPCGHRSLNPESWHSAVLFFEAFKLTLMKRLMNEMKREGRRRFTVLRSKAFNKAEIKTWQLCAEINRLSWSRCWALHHRVNLRDWQRQAGQSLWLAACWVKEQITSSNQWREHRGGFHEDMTDLKVKVSNDEVGNSAVHFLIWIC